MEDRRLLVAVVDDEEAVRKALRRLFLSAEIDVETFASGDDFLAALAAMSNGLPDCAVLDLHLPGLTGFDVLERIGESGIRLPTVMITGHDQAGAAERALAAGASSYLSKPLDDKILLAAVAEAVRAGGQ